MTLSSMRHSLWIAVNIVDDLAVKEPERTQKTEVKESESQTFTHQMKWNMTHNEL